MDLSELDTLCSDLTIAAKTLQGFRGISSTLSNHNEQEIETSLFATTPSETNHEISAAQRNLCAIATRIQTLLSGPGCFIRRMATQNQLLACLKWLGEFQVIACIPLGESISMGELANLADVPEYILSRVVRMTATAGFLYEPQHGCVAHTALSSSFTTELSYFDAAMFLADKVAPSALHLTSVTKDLDGVVYSASSKKDISSAYMLALNSPRSFALDCAERPQLNRQWLAYRHSVGILDDSFTALLGLLNWQSLGEASIVHVCDRYTESSKTLAQVSLAPRVIVQTYDFTTPDVHMATSGGPESGDIISHRISIQRRKPTTPQSVKDAAVYILQPSFPSMGTNKFTIHELLITELHSHFNVLRANPSALLILAPTILPEPGSVAIDLEVQARLRDFANLQLSSESTMEVTELFKLTESVYDRHGRLIVTNRLRSLDGATIGLAVQYQTFADSYQVLV